MKESTQRIARPVREGEPPRVPAVKCKGWCEYGDGHPTDSARVDQWCGSKQLTVDLHHIQDQADPINKFADNYLVTYVMQTPGEDPWVHLGFGEDAGWKLTVDESVSVALALLDQAERVRRNADADVSLIGIPVGERNVSDSPQLP